MSVSDHVVLSKSKEQVYESLFEKNEWLVVNDTMVDYNSNTSIIETAPLANNGKFVVYNKGYISVPLLITVTGEAALVKDDFKVAIKQSFLSLVNSITVDLNGQNIVQQNNLIDIVNNFQLLTQESNSTLPRWATIGFNPYNTGLDIRENYLTQGDNQTVISKNTLGTLQQSHASKDVGGCYQISARVIIYLKDLHPVFQALPVSKSLNFKIQLFWNASSATMDAAKTYRSSIRAYNGTNPLEIEMISGKAMEASVYVGNKCLSPLQKDLANVGTGMVGTQVQLFVPAVQMKPEIEQDYFATNRVKEVKYNDYYTFTINKESAKAGQSFNKLLSNGITDLKSVIIVPFSTDLNKENENPLRDGLSKPYGHFTNLQVLVGGLNVMASELRYTHQSFTQEILNSFGVNANESPGIGSGMMGAAQWFEHPVYVVDCSRTPDAISNQYRSLQISGTNTTSQDMEIVVFACYQRTFKLSTDTVMIE